MLKAKLRFVGLTSKSLSGAFICNVQCTHTPVGEQNSKFETLLRLQDLGFKIWDLDLLFNFEIMVQIKLNKMTENASGS